MPLPANWTIITVTGKFTRIDGSPAKGSVEFRTWQPVTVGGQNIVPASIVATLDADGAFEVGLPSTNDPDINPKGWAYVVNEQFEGGRDRYFIMVPYDAGDLVLADIVPAVPMAAYLDTGAVGVVVGSQAQANNHEARITALETNNSTSALYCRHDNIVANAGDNTVTLDQPPYGQTLEIFVNRLLVYQSEYTGAGKVYTLTTLLEQDDVVTVRYWAAVDPEESSLGYVPTLETIIAKAGSQSTYFDLRESSTLFQDTAGTTTPVTASGQPLGAIRDSLNGHLASAASDATRAEYWVDPLTSEPVSWYNLVDGALLWPTIEGATGTYCVAYSTGAQVFDMTAQAHLPTGPMIACYFFDYVLPDLEAEVMKAHMDAMVADASWLGYVIDTTYVDGIVPVSAGLNVHFSADPTHVSDNWPDYGGIANLITLSSARQRFRITVDNPSEFNDANAASLPFGSLFGFDALGGTLWAPDIDSQVSPLINDWRISFAALAGLAALRYGAVELFHRASSYPLRSVTIYNTEERQLYDLYIGRMPSGWPAPSSLVSLTCYETEIHVFGGQATPTFDAATSLSVVALDPANFNAPTETTGVSGTFPAVASPDVRSYYFSGYTEAQPCPAIPPKCTYFGFDYSNLTTMVDLTGLSGAYNIYIQFSDMPGVFPSLTDATSNVAPEVNTARILLVDNKITGYAGGAIFPDTPPGKYFEGGIQIRFTNNLITEAGADAVLKGCLDGGYVNDGGAPCRCYLNGSGNSAPSALGLTYASALEANGWTVHLNT